jgi:cell division protein FtsQ
MALDPTPASTTRWWLTLLQAIAAMLGLALVAAIVFEIQDAREAGVTRLEVEGNFDKVDPEALRDALKTMLAAGGSMPRMDEVKAQLEQLPWVSRARVERAWPGIVRVRVWEFEPFARWNDGLLSSEGQVFRVPAEQIPQNLPQLRGPDGRALEVRDTFTHLRTALLPTGFAPAGLSLSERGDWVARTDEGIELRFGRDALDEQIDLINGPVSQALAGKRSEVMYVDLHYSNGFAVGFKPVPRKATHAAVGVKP